MEKVTTRNWISIRTKCASRHEERAGQRPNAGRRHRAEGGQMLLHLRFETDVVPYFTATSSWPRSMKAAVANDAAEAGAKQPDWTSRRSSSNTAYRPNSCSNNSGHKLPPKTTFQFRPGETTRRAVSKSATDENRRIRARHFIRETATSETTRTERLSTDGISQRFPHEKRDILSEK